MVALTKTPTQYFSTLPNNKLCRDGGHRPPTNNYWILNLKNVTSPTQYVGLQAPSIN